MKVKGSYENGSRQGYWECYYGNGKLMYKGFFKKGSRQGYWEWYEYDGKLEDKQFIFN